MICGFHLSFHSLSLLVGGVAKSQNSSQMNLSGSSSSLTSDASSKATVSLRSYGIGGALLHKRILLMTRQCSQESRRERDEEQRQADQQNRLEDEEKEMVEEQMEAVQRGLFSSEQRKGRCKQQSDQGAQTHAGQSSLRVRAGSPAPKRKKTDGDHPMVQSGSPYSFPAVGLTTLSPLCESHLMRPKPPESPIRRRLMSPFRILRERSMSRERPAAVSPHLTSREGTAEMSSSPHEETRGQAEQRAGRSISPNPFQWLCRDRHTRRKTL